MNRSSHLFDSVWNVQRSRKTTSKLRSLRRKYLKAILSGKKVVNINMYGVYCILTTKERYSLTNISFSWSSMKFPNESIYTDDDVQIYRRILLMTNAHRRNPSPSNQVMGSKGHKYKNIIAPIVLNKKVGQNKQKNRFIAYYDNKQQQDWLYLLEWSQWNCIVCDCSKPCAKVIMVITTRFYRQSRNLAKPVWLLIKLTSFYTRRSVNIARPINKFELSLGGGESHSGADCLKITCAITLFV